MRRFHLFEFGDMPWCPRFIRDAETGYLRACYRIVRLPRLWAERMARFLPAGPVSLVDLAAGSGGPFPKLLDELKTRGIEARVTLTDLYPSPIAIKDGRIQYEAESINGTKVPARLNGARTIFSGFHHFQPDAAQAILRDAFSQRRPIFVFESGPGGVLGVIACVTIPMHVLLFTPLIRPVNWLAILFTYLIPVIPFIILWDGVVSNLRAYSPEMMDEMVLHLHSPAYEWHTGRIRVFGIPGGMPYLAGRPTVG